MENNNLKGLTFIDLFAGLGGFRIALESFGAECVFSSEWESTVAKVYEENFNDKPSGDITKIEAKDIPKHDILCAGFPCQAFSISGKKLGFDDSRGTLFFDIARIVKKRKPKIVFLENVKNFATHDNGKTLKVVEATMIELGYSFFYKILNASDFGVPQNRQRIYMVCFRKDLKIKSFEFPEKKSINKNLKSLLMSKEEIASSIKTYNKNIIPKFKDNRVDNKPIRLGVVGKGGQGERVYSTNGIAITLSSNGGGKFSKTGGYYIDNKIRKLHPRECARLMGFPETYKLASNFNDAYKHLGNSVVIDVLIAILEKINSYLD
jgi:DNA (cytosine-5)-methyltransferase 1